MRQRIAGEWVDCVDDTSDRANVERLMHTPGAIDIRIQGARYRGRREGFADGILTGLVLVACVLVAALIAGWWV